MKRVNAGPRRAPLVCALVATALTLPGLSFPFLSDDWALLEAVEARPTLRTQNSDFRPFFMASLWLDRKAWGLSPVLFHLTQLGLVALATALVVRVVQRYTRDRPLAFGAGLLFALHPYHVETAAWIASRADPLFSVFFLLSLLAYERWRVRAQGPPGAALLWCEAALLSKESAICLPIFLAALSLIDPARRTQRRTWLRGILPLALLTAAHFALRFLVLRGPGRTLLGGGVAGKIKTALGFTAAAVLPLDPERLSARPAMWGFLAAGLFLALVIAARKRAGIVPPLAIAAALLFAVLILPNVVGFQRRYFFLPAAAACVVLASLLRAAGRRVGVALVVLLVAGWASAGFEQWRSWRQAARVSRRLVGDLASLTGSPSVLEIVVANMPLRIADASVGGDMRAALRLSGHRSVPILSVGWVSYPSADADALDGPPSGAIRGSPSQVEVRFLIAEGPNSRFAGPHSSPGVELARDAYGFLSEDGRRLRVRILPAPERGRAAVAWTGGRLIPLFNP